MMRISRLALITAASVFMAACNTPQVALDQANHGVRLAERLKTEVEGFRQRAELEAHRKLIEIEVMSREASAEAVVLATYENRAKLAGQTALLEARRLMRADLEFLEKALADQQAADRAFAKEYDELRKSAAVPPHKIEALQKALADLGTEIPLADRMDAVASFMKQAKETVDKVKQSASATPGAAPAAPASPGSTAAPAAAPAAPTTPAASAAPTTPAAPSGS